MVVTITIPKIRLGKSIVKTPDLKLIAYNPLNCKHVYLEGLTDLILSILSAKNGEACINREWLPLNINKADNRILKKDNQLLWSNTIGA